MKHFALGTSAIALLTGLAGPVLADDVTAWRLFVSDHAEPVVHVLDALTHEEITHFDISGPASLYRSESGAGVYAVQTSANTVSVIKSGITFHDHGDHADIDVADPALSEAEFTGEYPVHFVEHDGHWAIFFDKEGVARVFEEHEALEGHVETREIATSGPHHGVAIPFGNFDLITTPNATDPSELPENILTLDQNGQQLGEPASCPGLHGEATSGNIVAIAPQTLGTVVAIGADDGDRVTAGQVLVKLDPNDAEVAYEQAVANLAGTVRQVRGLFSDVKGMKAQVAAQKVEVQKNQDNYNRRKSLAAGGAISQEELSHARDDLSSAQSALRNAEQKLDTTSALVVQALGEAGKQPERFPIGY